MKCPQKCTVSHLNVYTYMKYDFQTWNSKSLKHKFKFPRISHQEWTQRSTTCCQLIEPPSTPSSSSLTLRSRWRRTPWSTWSAPWLTMLALSIRCPVSDIVQNDGGLVMVVVALVIVKTISIPGNPWRGIPKWCDCELRKYWQFWQEISCQCPPNLIYQYIYCINLLMIIDDWFQCHECQII